MAKSTTVILAGKAYEIQALPIRQAAAWRRMLAQPFDGLTTALAEAGEIQLTNGRDLAALVQTVSGTLIGSIDQLLELLFAYAPALAQDRERIESEAYDDEALHAFTEVLKLAYPFGELLNLVRGARTAPTR